MLRQSAGVSVKNDGLGGHFRHIVDGAETGSHIHQFDIRLALRRGIAQGADPHSIELIQFTVMFHNGLLRDQSCQSAVYLQRFYNGTDLDQLSQSFSAVFRHRQLFFYFRINALYLFIIGIRHIQNLAAVSGKQLLHVVADGLQRPLQPVVPMDHIVRMQFFDDLVVHDVILYHHIADLRNVFYQLHALLKADGGKTIETDHGFVAQYADGQFSVLSGFSDNIAVSLVNDIRAETGIYSLHINSSFLSTTYSPCARSPKLRTVTSHILPGSGSGLLPALPGIL